jgi:flagellar motor switch protein FliM
MNELLTEQETAALLEGIEDGSIATDTGLSARGQVQPFDFAAHDTVFTGQWPLLEQLNERLATRLTRSLQRIFRQVSAVRFAGLYHERYGDYTSGLNVPSAIHVLDLAPLPGAGLLVLDTAFMYLGVDSRFGGPCRPPVVSRQRSFTRSEQLILTQCRGAILEDLKHAWHEIEPIAFDVRQIEFDPRYLKMAPPTTELLASRFEVQFGAELGTLTLVIPRSTMHPIEARLSGSEYARDEGAEQWRADLLDTVLDVELDLDVILAEVPVRFRDIIAMEAGDVFPLDFDQTVTAGSGDMPLFTGRIGTARQRRAMMLSGPADSPAMRKPSERLNDDE